MKTALRSLKDMETYQAIHKEEGINEIDGLDSTIYNVVISFSGV
jgi:hypothetical protein